MQTRELRKRGSLKVGQCPSESASVMMSDMSATQRSSQMENQDAYPASTCARWTSLCQAVRDTVLFVSMRLVPLFTKSMEKLTLIRMTQTSHPHPPVHPQSLSIRNRSIRQINVHSPVSVPSDRVRSPLPVGYICTIGSRFVGIGVGSGIYCEEDCGVH